MGKRSQETVLLKPPNPAAVRAAFQVRLDVVAMRDKNLLLRRKGRLYSENVANTTILRGECDSMSGRPQPFAVWAFDRLHW